MTPDIKHNPAFFSEDPVTPEEQLLNDIKDSQKPKEESVPTNTAIQEVNEEDISALPASAQERITDLLDKYYNGDRDVDKNHRFDNRAAYKAKLIEAFKHYGIRYVEQYHYPLSRDEKHIIRMDFYGSINSTKEYKLSPLYLGYLRTKNHPQRQQEPPSLKKKRGEQKKSQQIPISTISYPLSSYDLGSSPAWRLFRLFPRFTKLENRMLKTIQDLHIPPEQLKLLSVYDYSDLLYRTFRKSEDSPDANLFLGARQAFIKDLFRKHEAWLRDFLARYNVPQQYIDILVKQAKSKGTTNSVNILSDKKALLCNYISLHSNEFQQFIIDSIRSDNYAENIRQRIQKASFEIHRSALEFLQTNHTNFVQFIKRDILETQYIERLCHQFNNFYPTYVVNDIKLFLQESHEEFTKYLSSFGNPRKLEHQILQNLSKNDLSFNNKIVRDFIQQHQEDFFIMLLDKTHSSEYANFALKALSQTPVINDFGKELLSSFILSNRTFSEKPSPEIIQKVKKQGLTDDLLSVLAPFILKNKENLSTYFKEHNVLTFNELQKELLEVSQTIIQTTKIPFEMEELNKNFVLSHSSVFKNWYLNKSTIQYRKDTEQTFQEIAQSGVTEKNEGLCYQFIRERLNNFIAFASEREIPSGDVLQAVKKASFQENEKLAETVHEFILTYGSTFKNFLLQQKQIQEETKFEVILKKIKQQGITSQMTELVHKFILDNQPLYMEHYQQDKLLSNQAEQIYSRITSNKGSAEDKAILSAYLNANIYNYMIFQQDEGQLLPYVKNIAKNAKYSEVDATTEHWMNAYATATKEQFEAFMDIQGVTHSNTAEETQISFENGYMVVSFPDGKIFKLKLEVHHKRAIKDSARAPITDIANAEDIHNIASINDFSNLCLFTEFWHKVMHSMDSTEPVEDRERFVARLMPEDENIVIFGGEAPEDKLSYDYKSDPRTKRYDKKLATLIQQYYQGQTNV